MEVIDPNNSDPYLHVDVHSGEHYTSTTKAEKIHYVIVLALYRMLSSPPTLHLSWRQILSVNTIDDEAQKKAT